MDCVTVEHGTVRWNWHITPDLCLATLWLHDLCLALFHVFRASVYQKLREKGWLFAGESVWVQIQSYPRKRPRESLKAPPSENATWILAGYGAPSRRVELTQVGGLNFQRCQQKKHNVVNQSFFNHSPSESVLGFWKLSAPFDVYKFLTGLIICREACVMYAHIFLCNFLCGF
jgi:hypothetical protein